MAAGTDMTMLIDTHAHLYHRRFQHDLSEVLTRAYTAGVTAMVLPAIDVSSIHAALGLCERESGLYAMAALHPSSTREASEEDFEAVRTFCDDSRIVAVGESGLDYYWDRSFDLVQQDVYRRHVRLAIEKNLPLILHVRAHRGHDEPHRDIVRILREERAQSQNPERLRGIFHCFTGPAWFADAAKELGFLIGIGGAITFKNGGVDALAASIPLEMMVLETDSPFLAPVPYRGKRNEPAYVRRVADKLALVKGVPVEEVERVTTDNAVHLFGLDI